MSTKIVRIFALVATVGFAACDETSDVVLGELTEFEAQQLAGVVMSATFNSSSSVPQQPALSPDGPAAVPFEFATEIETVVQCPLGGVVDVAASLEVNGDTESEAANVQYSMTQIHDGCMATSEEGKTFTLWGNPSMNAAFTVENNGQGVVEWAGSIEGTIDWESDGFEGSCSVALEFAGRDETGASSAAELFGTVCGFSIDQSMSIG